MRSPALCTKRASCTDGTGYRTDDARHAGIIRRTGPRTGPHPKSSCLVILLLYVTSLRAPCLHPGAVAAVMGPTVYRPPSSPPAVRHVECPGKPARGAITLAAISARIRHDQACACCQRLIASAGLGTSSRKVTQTSS